MSRGAYILEIRIFLILYTVSLGIPYIYKLFWIDIQVRYFPFKTVKFSNSQVARWWVGEWRKYLEYHKFINFSGLTSKFDISLLKPLNFQTVKLLHCKTEMIQIRVIPNFFVHPAFTKIYPESWFLGLFFDKDRYILYALRKFTHIYKTN